MIDSRAHSANTALLVAFGAAGVVAFDGYSWGLGAALVLAAGCYGAAWAAAQYPNLINVPDQAKYDALSGENKRAVIAVLQRLLYWCATVWIAALVVIQFIHEGWESPAREEWTIAIAILTSVVEGGLVIGAVLTMTRKVKALYEIEHGRRE